MVFLFSASSSSFLEKAARFLPRQLSSASNPEIQPDDKKEEATRSKTEILKSKLFSRHQSEPDHKLSDDNEEKRLAVPHKSAVKADLFSLPETESETENQGTEESSSHWSPFNRRKSKKREKAALSSNHPTEKENQSTVETEEKYFGVYRNT